MLNKLQVNNLITKHKKQIRQVKIQVVAKLVQKVRKLKCLQEKHDDESTKDKLRKTLECLEQMKKLKNAAIMKGILVLENKPTAILTNVRSTPDEMAIALLANNKLMQELIKKFLENLNLKESDKTWKKSLQEPSKKELKYLKTEKKREKRKHLKSQKELERKRQEWVKENTTFEMPEEKNENENEVLNEEVNSKRKSSVTDIEKTKENSKITKNQKEKKTKKPKKKENQEYKSNNIDEATSENTVKSQKIKSKSVNESKQSCDIGNFSPIKTYESEEIEVNKLESQKQTHAVDSFFFTSTGENYLATAVNELDEREDVEYATHTNLFAAKRRKLHVYENDKRPKSNMLDKNFQGRKTLFSDNGDLHILENEQNTIVESKTDPHLHPSWIAKQKLKPIIAVFQGKKITFD